MLKLKSPGLTVKTTLTLLILSLFSVALSGSLAVYLLRGEFSSYVYSNRMMRFEDIAKTIGDLYEATGRWDAVEEGIARSGPTMGNRIEILDLAGNPVISGDRVFGKGMPAFRRRTMGGMMRPRFLGNGNRASMLPIEADGRKVGTLVVYFNGIGGVFSRQDLAFRSAIARSILWGGLMSGIVASMMGILLSRRLSLPMEKVAQAISNLAGGHLEHRVPAYSDDEIGRLAVAFNTMADKLERQYYLRRKLTADVSHELRTPLAAIQAHIEAFQDGVMEPDHKNLESVLEEVKRLERLVSDLRELSVAESGAMVFKFVEVDLVKVTEQVTAGLDPLFHDKGIELRRSTSQSSVSVRADVASIEKIIMNLLSNAIRYTDSGGEVAVSVSTDGKNALLSVSDTGIGIPEGELPYIFERFYRTDTSRTRETGGTGVGLTIARELAVAHGGDISVDSRVGKGSRFEVRLPVAPSVCQPIQGEH